MRLRRRVDRRSEGLEFAAHPIAHWLRRLLTSEDAGGEVTLTGVLQDLKRLGLAGRYFGPLELARRLETRLDTRIRIAVIEDLDHPLLRRNLLYGGIRGGLLYAPETGAATVLVPSSAHPVEWAETIYHELSHLMAGHPLPVRGFEEGCEEVRLWLPPRRLSRRPVPRELAGAGRVSDLGSKLLDRLEGEADLMAEYLLLAGAYGPDIYRQEETLLGL